MNNMVEGTAKAAVDGLLMSADERWLQHRMKALKDFIKNVTVIDDQPITEADLAIEVENPDDDGLGDHIAVDMGELSSGGPESVPLNNSLNIRELSDAFADVGVACAFVLPENTIDSIDTIKSRVIRASRFSDMVIIDWHLRNANSNLTTQILTELAALDQKENGRLRLICIYTSQEVNQGILDDAIKALKAGGICLEQYKKNGNLIARSNTCLLTILSKSVTATELPDALLESFAELSDGILPTFALAAVGAIRKNAHHMVTRFGSDLDSAYVANRMITDPSGDVSEMLRDLFVSECDSALGFECVSDSYLHNDVLLNWLETRKLPKALLKYQFEKIDHHIDRDALSHLVKFGVNEKDILNAVGSAHRPLPTKKRNLVSESLAGTKRDAHVSERKFARLVALRREAFGGTKLSDDRNTWKPNLTTGSLLVSMPNTKEETQKWLLCLTPLCDTVRLKKKKQFTFLLASETEAKKANLILQMETGKDKKLYFDTKQPHFFTVAFVPDPAAGKVFGEESNKSSQPVFKFCSADGKKFTWLGEIRYARATKIIGELIGNWGRMGINDSEFLRLVEKGDFSIEMD